MKFKEIFLPWLVIKNLKEDLESERIRLAGCGVAALENTEESKKNRIQPDNPYWSASYGDVCRAVDAEIKYRTELAIERDNLDSILTSMGINPLDCRDEAGSLLVEKVRAAVLAKI